MAELKFEVDARWAGSGPEAVGWLETGGQVVPWSVPARMGGSGEGTSPEELLAAAAATCYASTLASLLTRSRLPWERIAVHMEETVEEQLGAESRIVALRVVPEVAGGEAQRLSDYQRTAELAWQHCFIGRHLRSEVVYEVGGVRLASAPVDDGLLDVRSLPPAQRHQLIFRTLDGLGQEGALTLVNDHDPLPLRYQLDATRSGQFSWDYLESGPQTWKVRIERQPAC